MATMVPQCEPRERRGGMRDARDGAVSRMGGQLVVGWHPLAFAGGKALLGDSALGGSVFDGKYEVMSVATS